MLKISKNLMIPDREIDFSAIRAQGAGGQNVNKVATAIHLRFDIKSSSLPILHQQRLLQLKDHRINRDGIIVIKAQKFRTQEKNRNDALERLRTLIHSATRQKKIRRPTKPTKSAQQKRINSKTQRGKIKALRGRVVES